MNKLITDINGGFIVKLNDIRFNDDAYRDALNKLLSGYGNNFIVTGCDYNVENNTISSGYILLDGELLKVDEHTVENNGYFQKLSTFDSNGLKTFKNGTIANTYQVNRGVAVANSGNLRYNGNTYRNLIATSLINDAKASSQQVSTGTANNVFITPLTLSARTATETSTGLIEIATNTEFKDKTVNNKAIVPSNFNQAWNTFSLIADDNDVTMISSTVRYFKLGRFIFMNVNAQFNVTGTPGSGNYIRLRESGVDFESLRPSSDSACGCKLYNPSSGFETGNVTIYDTSIASDRFLFDIRRYNGSNFTVTNSYNISFNIAYNSYSS